MTRAVAVPTTYDDAFAARAESRRLERDDVRTAREEAFARFRAHGFPTTRLEAWQKTSLAPVARTRYEGPAPPTEEQVAHAQALVDALRVPEETARFVLVDGFAVPSLCTHDALDGLTLAPLADRLAPGGAADAPRVGDLVPGEGPEWAVADLNTAFFRDGVYLRLAARQEVPGLVHVMHITTGGKTPLLVAPRHRIELGARSRLTLVSTYAGMGTGAVLCAPVTEVDLDREARLRHVKIQRELLTSSHVGLFSARVARDAVLEDLSFSLGAGLARHDVHASLSGQGAHTTLNGVFLGRGEQHVDHRTIIEHVVEDGTSRQSYRGIVDDAAHGVFTGKIIVRPGAQRTDADQQNKNLILSRKALVDSTPQLEIHADDVKCAHGSAIGQLDEAQLFYLRTRGFPEAEARLVLTEAFAREPLTLVGEDHLRGHLEGLVTDWFIAGHPDADPARGHSPGTNDPLRVPTAVGPRGGTRKTA